jgi:copper chaperone
VFVMPETTFHVVGMTCGHCVSAVREEVEKLDGVEEVAVDLDAGKVTVTSAHPVSDTDVRSAVEEAGYELIAKGTRPRPDRDLP